MPNKMKRPRSKRPSPARPLSSKASQVVPYSIKELYENTLSLAQTAPAGFFGSLYVYGTFQFRLSNIANFTKFTVLYDQYMIKKVTLRFMPVQRDNVVQFTDVLGGPAALTQTMFSGPSYLHMVPDFDDFTSPTTANEVLSRSNSKTLDLSSPASITIIPKATQKTADIVSNLMTIVPKANVWIDCSNANVDHLGFKYAWQVPVHNQSTIGWPYERYMSAIVTYELAFRYPRL